MSPVTRSKPLKSTAPPPVWIEPGITIEAILPIVPSAQPAKPAATSPKLGVEPPDEPPELDLGAGVEPPPVKTGTGRTQIGRYG
jgi:hypothetical protein